MRSAALLLVLALAGCAAPAGPPDAGSGPTDVLPWGMTACRYVVAFVPVDAAKLQARMPDGFVLETGRVAPLPVAPEGARLGIEAFECESGTGLHGPVPGLAYGSLFASATPPEALRDDALAFTFVKWETLVPDVPRRDLLAARGLPVRDGAVTWAAPPAQPPGAIFAQLRLDVGTFSFSLAATQTTAAPAPEDAPFAEFMPAEDGGIAEWRTRFAWDEGTQLRTGRGTVDLPAGSWAADVAGTTRAPATFHAGTWSFENGTITLPPRAG